MTDFEPIDYEKLQAALRAAIDVSEQESGAEQKYRDAEHAGQMELWRARNTTELEQFKARIQLGAIGLNATINFAASCLRSLFLINAGGAIGVLTFVGNIVTKSLLSLAVGPRLTETVLCFVGGIVTSVIATFFAYLTQDRLGTLMGNGAEKPTQSAFRLKCSAIGFAVISLICFIGGAVLGATVLQTARC